MEVFREKEKKSLNDKAVNPRTMLKRRIKSLLTLILICLQINKKHVNFIHKLSLSTLFNPKFVVTVEICNRKYCIVKQVIGEALRPIGGA